MLHEIPNFCLELKVNDMPTVEWILESSGLISKWLKDYFFIIRFGTLELVNHVHNNIHLLNHFFNNDDVLLRFKTTNYNYLWNKAIEQFDFNTISYLESLNIELTIYYIKFPTLSINQTIEFVNKFNEIGFTSNQQEQQEQQEQQQNNNNNKHEKYQLLFTQIINGFNQSSGSSGGDDNQMELFSNIRLNMRDYDISTVLMDAIKKMNLKMVELLLNSSCFDSDDNQGGGSRDTSNLFSFDNSEIERYRISFDYGGNIFHYEEREGATRIEIIEIIKKVIKRISQPTNKHSMVNYFYEKLISIKGITMNEVYQVYQLITQQHSITVNHDSYNIFWYLHIKDIKFTYYIISSYYLKLLYYRKCGDYDIYDHFGDKQINHYLKPEKFTFEVINSLPFDQVLEMLVYTLSLY